MLVFVNGITVVCFCSSTDLSGLVSQYVTSFFGVGAGGGVTGGIMGAVESAEFFVQEKAIVEIKITIRLKNNLLFDIEPVLIKKAVFQLSAFLSIMFFSIKNQ